MSRTEILMTIPIEQSIEDALKAVFSMRYLWRAQDPTAFLKAFGPAVRGLATSTRYGPIGSDFLDFLPNVELIASFGVGYDNVDIAEAARRGIVVTNTPGVLDDEVADLAMGLMLGTIRQIPQADRYLREGRWLEANFPSSATLRDRHVGIVGLGRIGHAIARRLDGFGVPIAYHGRHEQDGIAYTYHATLLGLAEACDVLVICAPGGPETRHLIDAHILRALGPDGVLINVARGILVDEVALIEALSKGTISAAGLDVYENEPHVAAGLIALPNVVLLPHLGSRTLFTRAAMGQLLVDNLIGWFEGRGALTPVAGTV